MSYAHCVIRAGVDESIADAIMDDLLQTVTAWPQATHGVYVVVIAESRALAVHAAKRAANSVPPEMLG